MEDNDATYHREWNPGRNIHARHSLAQGNNLRALFDGQLMMEDAYNRQCGNSCQSDTTCKSTTFMPFPQPSNHILSYTQQRQYSPWLKPPSPVTDYAARKMPSLLKEEDIKLGDINKVFASQWISDHQIAYGTKCNQLMVLDLKSGKQDRIPSLSSSSESVPAPCPCGIHSIAINPTRSMLATGGLNTNDVGVYKLPSFDPLCVGEGGHTDWIFDMAWLDDQHLLTASRDGHLCMWKINADSLNVLAPIDALQLNLPTYSTISPSLCKKARSTDKLRALTYNDEHVEVATLSLNANVYIWDLETFTQKMSVKLKYQRENVCMCLIPSKYSFAIGSQSHVTLVDPRSPKNTSIITSKQRGQGIRSLNCVSDVLSIGTGGGSLYFYDLRAGKYLNLPCGHAVSLNASKGYLLRDENYQDFFGNDDIHPNAIYTHQYDASHSRLFLAGGPLPAGLWGNYAGLWS